MCRGGMAGSGEVGVGLEVGAVREDMSGTGRAGGAGMVMQEAADTIGVRGCCDCSPERVRRLTSTA